MKNIISVSRRTDIPAYYGDWFIERVKEGAAGCLNPFSGKKYSISLDADDVLMFVFWSKNFMHFMDHLENLERMGYRFYLHFTITGLPRIFEPEVPDWKIMVDAAHRLAERFSSDHVQWRFDPIVFSSISPAEKILETFSNIADRIHGATRRCYFSYVMYYGKVRRNFAKLAAEQGLVFRAYEEDREKMVKDELAEEMHLKFDIEKKERIEFAKQLASIAARKDISLHSCCADYLIDNSAPPIFKARCVDPEIVSRILGYEIAVKENPTRKECGCFESRDIGLYDTCPHGCCYCYANVNKEKAQENYMTLKNNTGGFSLSVTHNREDYFGIKPHNNELF